MSERGVPLNLHDLTSDIKHLKVPYTDIQIHNYTYKYLRDMPYLRGVCHI